MTSIARDSSVAAEPVAVLAPQAIREEESVPEQQIAMPAAAGATATSTETPPTNHRPERCLRPETNPCLLGIFIIGLFIALYFARAILLPIASAVVLSLLLHPIVLWLAKLRIPRSIGAGIVIALTLYVFYFGASHLVEPASQWIDDAPKTLERLEYKLGFLRKPLEEISEAGEKVRKATDVSKDDAVEVKMSTPSLTDSVLSLTGSFVSSLLVTIVLLFFLLSSGDRLIHRVIDVASRRGDKRNLIKLSRSVQAGISVYLLSATAINCCLGICVGTSLWLVGMPNPLLWGTLAAILNFVPYLGAIAGVTIVGIDALVSFDELGRVLLAAGSYAGLNALEGNVISPLILGRRLDLNPALIFVSLVFWGWLWGVVGALLAVPILVCFKLCCDHVERLQPVGRLLTR